jgi:hypothetical protein
MNTPPSTAQPLDHFESALLGELREHVATRSAPDLPMPAATPRRHHVRRWAIGAVGAAAAAAVAVVVAPGGPGASPAYAVQQAADGDVVVTIHRLEDAAGLERALRENGIDADVSFEGTSRLDELTFQMPDGEVGPPPPGESGSVERKSESGGEGPRLDSSEAEGFTEAEPAEPGDEIDPGGCGTGQPATLRQDGGDWVLRIPADSPLQDREVAITTVAGGDLAVAYPGDSPNSYCGVASVG